MVNYQKIVRGISLSFLFVAVTIVVFCGVQWFSDSMESLLINRGVISPASLETSINQVSAIVNDPAVFDKNIFPIRKWQVENVVLQAKSGLSVEIGDNNSKILFNQNSEVRLPIASLTKLMTAMVVLSHYDLSAKVTMGPMAMAQIGEQGDLKLGQEFTVKNLLYTTLMESNNRSAYALSEVLGNEEFIGLMNQDAKNLGMTNTNFQDVTGLDPSSYSTAKDLVIVTQYLFKNYPLFNEIIRQKEYNLYLYDGIFHHKAVNTNILLGENNIFGGKTGFTKVAQGCFMILQESPQEKSYIISILLGSQDRFLEMKKLIDWLGMAYQWQ
ncbi:MAG: D-alanyl-D-alanine carboxypeptidase [Candidatus Staskawiczbacteria bacterium]|nr:D-alanyl-D-alanine carboxypeptidase [Candidatus Staskawiczbacteria bacterium]